MQTDSLTTLIDDSVLSITTSAARASGKVTTEGFVVFEGAVLNQKTSVKSLSAGMQKLRESLIASEKVKDWVTTEDILFSSSSAAADFVLGYSVSGPQTWKAKDGRPLKEIEKNEMNGVPFNMALPENDSKAERAARALQELSNAAVKNGTSEMTLEEINAEIDAVRKKDKSRFI